LRHGEQPISSLIPQPLPGYTSFNENSLIQILAQKILAKAGYPNGKNFPRVYLLYPHREDTRLLVEAIQDELKRNLNIHIDLLNQEWQVYYRHCAITVLLCIERPGEQIIQIQKHLWNLFTSHNGNNNTHWSDSKYDQLVSDAACEANPQKRVNLYKTGGLIICVKRRCQLVPLNNSCAKYTKLSPGCMVCS